MPERLTREETIKDSWYPKPSDYWVPSSEADAWPYRYGDLFAAPPADANGTPLENAAGEPWHAVMVMWPSCELVSKAKPMDSVDVVRVYRLEDQKDPKAVAAITAGWQERNSVIGIAFAHTVFLAPVEGHTTHDAPMFANLKSTSRVTLGDLYDAGRVAALTHEARVGVIRREIYFRYRWLVSTSQVQTLEQVRIGNDAAFTPPRPDWAPFAPAD